MNLPSRVTGKDLKTYPANTANAFQLTKADKRHAILLALQTWPDKGPSVIAAQLGCTDRWAREVRSEVSSDLPDRTTGKDGKSYLARRPSSKPTPKPKVMPDRSPAVVQQRIA